MDRNQRVEIKQTIKGRADRTDLHRYAGYHARVLTNKPDDEGEHQIRIEATGADVNIRPEYLKLL